MKIDLALLDAGSSKNVKLWVAKLMLLFQVTVRDCEKEKEYAFSQYTDVTPQREDFNRALEGVSLRRSTDDDTDYASARRDRSSALQQ